MPDPLPYDFYTDLLDPEVTSGLRLHQILSAPGSGLPRNHKIFPAARQIASRSHLAIIYTILQCSLYLLWYSGHCYMHCLVLNNLLISFIMQAGDVKWPARPKFYPHKDQASGCLANFYPDFSSGILTEIWPILSAYTPEAFSKNFPNFIRTSLRHLGVFSGVLP